MKCRQAVSALGEVINDGVIHPEEKVKVKADRPFLTCVRVKSIFYNKHTLAL